MSWPPRIVLAMDGADYLALLAACAPDEARCAAAARLLSGVLGGKPTLDSIEGRPGRGALEPAASPAERRPGVADRPQQVTPRDMARFLTCRWPEGCHRRRHGRSLYCERHDGAAAKRALDELSGRREETPRPVGRPPEAL